MKKCFQRAAFVFLLCLGISSLSWSQAGLPRPQGYVSDFAGVLSSQDRSRVEMFCSQLEKKTGAQVAVVTVASVRPDTVEQYAVKLFEQWGIGQKGKDNGVLFLTAVSDREVRIEVGYGLEGAIPDAIVRSVIERFIVPAFQQGEYSKGIGLGTAAIASLVAKEYGVEVTGSEDDVYQKVHHEPSRGSRAFMLIIFVSMLILFIKNPRLFMYWMMMSMMSGGRGGYGGGGGSFGGGFGGFGGGMSGGGGASGRR